MYIMLGKIYPSCTECMYCTNLNLVTLHAIATLTTYVTSHISNNAFVNWPVEGGLL